MRLIEDLLWECWPFVGDALSSQLSEQFNDAVAPGIHRGSATEEWTLVVEVLTLNVDGSSGTREKVAVAKDERIRLLTEDPALDEWPSFVGVYFIPS